MQVNTTDEISHAGVYQTLALSSEIQPTGVQPQ